VARGRNLAFSTDLLRRLYNNLALPGQRVITETINTLFPVNLLKCVVTEVVLFSVVAFNTLTFHKVVWRHILGAVRFVVQYNYKCSPDSASETSLKIDRYLMKLKCMKFRRTKSVPFLGATVYTYTHMARVSYKFDDW